MLFKIRIGYPCFSRSLAGIVKPRRKGREVKLANIEIRRPQPGDVEKLYRFFELVLRDTFAKEGLAHLAEDLEREISDKKRILKEDIQSNGEKRYFLTALMDGEVIGTIEYGPTGQIILDCTKGELESVVEVGTVFIHPDYQRQGIGTLMLNAICLTLLGRNIDEFCRDSGYKNAQRVWRRKFGEPAYVIRDYWGEGFDHMIWRKHIKDLPIVFRI
jgi:GNAT superfamily N-acetyltransferase